VTGIEAERVYRSRSVAKLLFDAIPSKGQALGGLSWFNFERYCGGWLRRQGFDEVARKSVDRGVDITAFKDRSGKAEEWSVQCKHWANKVGPDVVRELEGARRLRNADRAMLITSSAFTPAAIQTASELGIVLVDGDQLSDGDV
jgi:restriction system protein